MKAFHNLIPDRLVVHAFLVAVSCIEFCTTIVAQTVEEHSPEEDWFTMYFVEGYGFLVAFVVSIIALLIFRKLRSGRAKHPSSAHARVEVQPQPATAPAKNGKPAATAASRETAAKERRGAPWETTSIDYTQEAFGAYRIDQEVGKLVLGKAHRMDVLASRFPEDRRAIEASLIKSLGSSDAESEGRERAKRALEDYGFVARQSALLLEGRDAWERSSAARVLGQIGSPSSLPALIEALHDGDSIVRNQAVTSLGQLKQPTAIGPLLDIGRRYSDIPPTVLSESLSACSIEGLGFLDSTPFDLNEPMAGIGESATRLARGPLQARQHTLHRTNDK